MKGRNCLHCQFELVDKHRAICERCAKCYCNGYTWCGCGQVTRKRQMRKAFAYRVKNIMEAER